VTVSYDGMAKVDIHMQSCGGAVAEVSGKTNNTTNPGAAAGAIRFATRQTIKNPC
jgi:hypothetical protein